jgi:hypothetical protein
MDIDALNALFFFDECYPSFLPGSCYTLLWATLGLSRSPSGTDWRYIGDLPSEAALERVAGHARDLPRGLHRVDACLLSENGHYSILLPTFAVDRLSLWVTYSERLFATGVPSPDPLYW